jgi:hypothetical protein
VDSSAQGLRDGTDSAAAKSPRPIHLFVDFAQSIQEARAIRQFYFVQPRYFMTNSAGDDETNYL